MSAEPTADILGDARLAVMHECARRQCEADETHAGGGPDASCIVPAGELLAMTAEIIASRPVVAVGGDDDERQQPQAACAG